MPFSLLDVFYGVVLPAAAGSCICMILRRFISNPSAAHKLAPLAFAVAFSVGYVALRPGPLVPEKQWHWLPLICLAGSLCSFSFDSNRKRMLLQLSLWLVVAVGAAMLLTPVRNSLQPSRGVWLTVWPVLVVFSVWLAAGTFQKADARSLSFILCLQFFSASVLLLLSGSLRFSQLALIGFGAASGLVLASVTGKPAMTGKPALSLIHTNFASAILLWGLMLTGRVNSFSQIPWLCYLLIPFATVMPGLLLSSTVEQQIRRSHVARSVGYATAPCAIALAVAVYYYLN